MATQREKNWAELPEGCFIALDDTGWLGYIRRGESKVYHEVHEYDSFAQAAGARDRLNESLGITKWQHEAMLNGSVFGCWDALGASPSFWEQQAKSKK